MQVFKTLFLDRDGVINIEKDGSYIFYPDEFHFYEGTLEALKIAAELFDKIVIVTNQRGIGRGFMTTDQLRRVHEYMLQEVKKAGGRIDSIYFSPHLHNDHVERKPNTGMGLMAKQEDPRIDFAHATMIGNNLSDMEFGKRLGMNTIFLHTTQSPIELPHALIDEQYDSLYNWAITL